MPNLVLVRRSTPHVFADTAQGTGLVLTLSGLGAGSGGIGRISDRLDLGAGATPGRFAWRTTYQLSSPGNTDEFARLYFGTSDGSNPDGEIGVVDATLSLDQARALKLLGFAPVTTASINTNITGSGTVTLLERYISVGFFAPQTSGLRADGTVHRVILTPAPDEIQDSA